MGYFDGLTNGMFKTDSDGRLLFYPWDVCGSGYVLSDDSKKEEVRKFVSLWYKISLPVLFGIGVGIGWIFALPLLPLVFFWYYFTTARLLRGLPTTSTRLTLRESYTSSAKSHTAASLRFLLALSIAFVLAGLLVLLVKREEWIIGLASILFFGLCAIGIGYMMKLKNT
jgi:hypothetical protein